MTAEKKEGFFKPQSQHNKLPGGNVDVCESCENDLK